MVKLGRVKTALSRAGTVASDFDGKSWLLHVIVFSKCSHIQFSIRQRVCNLPIFISAYSDHSMNKLLRFLLPAVACFFTVPGTANAQFVSSGPNGGAAYSFYRDNSRLLVAGSGGIYVSNDEGKTWRETSMAPSVFGCDPIYSVAASGPDVYGGSQQSGIFHSLNSGTSWINSSSGLRIAFGAPYKDIEFAGPNVLAIRPDSGFLFLSTNQGANWARINLAIGNSFAQYLCSHNGEVYVSTLQGLFKTNNNGLNFLNVNSSPADFGKLVWSGDTGYVATSTGIKMSVDQGANFVTVALAGRAVRDVAVSGSNMYAVVRNPAPIQDSVLYSTNGGASFNAAPFAPGQFRFTTVNDLAVTVNGVLVATNYGIYGTANNGNTWGLADSGYNATTIRGLAVAGAYVVAGAYPMGVYRVMPDSGALAWQHSGDVADGIDGNIQTIAAKGALVHLGSSSGYYRSADSGANWVSGATGASGGNIASLHADPMKSDVFMIRNGNLYYSSDDGLSFGQVINSNIPNGVGRLVVKADTAVFVASFSTLYKAGSTMAFSAVSGITGVVTAILFMGNNYYAATAGNGLFTSTNGASWAPVAIAPPGILPNKINALITDSAGTGLIAGTDDGFYSNTSGTWTRDGLAGHVVSSLAMRAGKLFVGTCSGVYSVPYKVIPPPAGVGGTAKPASATMEIWPNPTNGNFSLRFQNARSAEAELVVRDMMGTIVLRQNVSLKAGSNELHISAKAEALAAGIYTVQVSGDVVRTARIVLY